MMRVALFLVAALGATASGIKAEAAVGRPPATLTAMQGVTSVPVWTVQQRKLIRGPKGGCYYINKNGNKTYVDRSRCR